MPLTIGILQTGSCPVALMPQNDDYPAQIIRLLKLKSREYRFRTYRCLDGELPGHSRECAAWIITGSRHSVLSPSPWVAALTAFVRAAIEDGSAVLGICFGHQLMAVAMGGEVSRHPTGWCIGRQQYRFSDSHQQPQTLELNAFHQDQVSACPPAAKLLAGSGTCRFAVLGYGDRALSFQAHPEFSNRFTRQLILHRLAGKIPDDDICRAIDSLERSPDSGRAAQMIADRIFRCR